MSTGGANGGIYIGAPGTIGAAIARDDRLKLEDQAARQAQAGNIALRSLIGGMQAPGTPATKAYEVNGRTIGQNREATAGGMNPATQLGLLSKFAPGAVQSVVASQVMQQLFPQGFTGTVGQDQIAYQNGKVVAEGPKSAPKVDKLPAEAELAKWLFGGNEAAAREYIKNKDAPKQEGSWRTLTPAEAQQMNLNPSGSYQVNEKGQIQVITQPKQDAPTETQSKYAYNAKRVADGLSAVNSILEKDKGASSSWWLNATTDSLVSNIPGVPELGRKTASDNTQIVRNNMADVVDAVITLGTGAAYTQEQLKAARNSFLPQPGESQKVKQDKFRKLASIYEQARANARTAGQDLPDISQFGVLFGKVDDGGPPMSRENDPLGIRGR